MSVLKTILERRFKLEDQLRKRSGPVRRSELGKPGERRWMGSTGLANSLFYAIKLPKREKTLAKKAVR